MDIAWCQRFDIEWIGDLKDRVVGEEDYKKLWHTRCDRGYNLIMGAEDAPEEMIENDGLKLYLYGADEDLKIYYYEDKQGVSWKLENGKLRLEDGNGKW